MVSRSRSATFSDRLATLTIGKYQENIEMSEYSLFTSESVSEGHPDKIADQISDAVLDAIIAEDKFARVACETLVKTGVAIIAGEVTTTAWVDLEQIVRDVITDIGYNSSDVGFDGATCGVMNIIGKQSPTSTRVWTAPSQKIRAPATRA